MQTAWKDRHVETTSDEQRRNANEQRGDTYIYNSALNSMASRFRARGGVKGHEETKEMTAKAQCEPWTKCGGFVADSNRIPTEG
jgi:hypothetical protein